MLHGVIEANSSARAVESRLVNDSDDADGFLTSAALYGCQYWCAQVAGGIPAGLCSRPLQPIITQHSNLPLSPLGGRSKRGLCGVLPFAGPWREGHGAA